MAAVMPTHLRWEHCQAEEHQRLHQPLLEAAVLGSTAKIFLLGALEAFGAQSLARKVLTTDLAAEAILYSLDGAGATGKQRLLELIHLEEGGFPLTLSMGILETAAKMLIAAKILLLNTVLMAEASKTYIHSRPAATPGKTMRGTCLQMPK